jgi:hypothetical protein
MNPKSLFLTLLGASVTQIAQACIYAQTYTNTCAVSGDIIFLKVWWDDRLVCFASMRKNWASGEVFSFNENNGCDKGTRVEVTNNGKNIRYWGSDGYASELTLTTSNTSSFTCLDAGDNGNVRGNEYEACASDRGGGCEKYPCKLCSFKDQCLAGMGVPIRPHQV